MSIDFGATGNHRQYACFVCGVLFKEYPEFKAHILEVHEEGREYILCPVKHCGAPVRDLRGHFRNKHPACKCPEDRQLRAMIMYDIQGPNKRKKLPNFASGFHVSPKNNNKKMHYRSSYELQVYECLDKLGDVARWEVEPFSVPYYFRGKKKQYFPDLLIEFSDGSIEIWEIKPAKQTVLEVNQAKWTAAKHYCQMRGWAFEPITEQRIQQLKKKAGN